MPGRFDLSYELWQGGPNSVRMRYVSAPDSECSFGFPKREGDNSVTIGPVLKPELYFREGCCTFTCADGKTQDHPLPVPRGQWENVAATTLKTARGATSRLFSGPHC